MSAVIVLVGVVSSGLIFFFVRRMEASRIQAEFNQLSAERSGALSVSVVSSLGSLEALQHSDNILQVHDRNDFAHMLADVQQLMNDTFGGDQSIETIIWAPRVTGTARSAFETATRHQTHHDFIIEEFDAQGHRRTAGSRRVYFPVLLTDPMSQKSALWGIDLASDPVLR
jgi:CHASE1-domain containing sensor protein